MAEEYTFKTDKDFQKELNPIIQSYNAITNAGADDIIGSLERQRNALKAYKSLNPVVNDIKNRKIYYHKTGFKGVFSIKTIAELQKLGAKWDKKTRSYAIEISKLPTDIKEAIFVINTFNNDLQNQINAYQSGQLKNKKQITDNALILAGLIALSDVFAKTKQASDDFLHKNVPDASTTKNDEFEQRVKAAVETFDYDIKKRSYEATKKMRKEFMHALIHGKTNEELKQIVKHHIEGNNYRNDFITKQESRLLLVEYQKKLFKQQGVTYFKWVCPDPQKPTHRPQHKIWGDESNHGKLFRLDKPPYNPDSKKKELPGEPYNCGCLIHIVLKKQQ